MTPARRALCLTLVAALAACSAPGRGLPPLPDATRSAYRLGPDDQVRVTVFNDPRLTGDFRVSDAGTIALPLVSTHIPDSVLMLLPASLPAPKWAYSSCMLFWPSGRSLTHGR